MADTKISALTELTTPDIDDELVIVDKSDTTMAGSGTDKRIKVQTLIDQAAARSATGSTPTGITYQNLARATNMAATIAAAGTGKMKLTSIWLPAGFSVASISYVSGTTALALGTSPHFWVALYDSSLGLLRQSTDQTSATWTASTLKTTSLSSAYPTTYTGVHYCALMVVAGGGGTMPTLQGISGTANTVGGLAPVASGTDETHTGLTATASNPAATLTVASGVPYCGVA